MGPRFRAPLPGLHGANRRGCAGPKASDLRRKVRALGKAWRLKAQVVDRVSIRRSGWPASTKRLATGRAGAAGRPSRLGGLAHLAKTARPGTATACRAQDWHHRSSGARAAPASGGAKAGPTQQRARPAVGRACPQRLRSQVSRSAPDSKPKQGGPHSLSRSQQGRGGTLLVSIARAQQAVPAPEIDAGAAEGARPRQWWARAPCQARCSSASGVHSGLPGARSRPLPRVAKFPKPGRQGRLAAPALLIRGHLQPIEDRPTGRRPSRLWPAVSIVQRSPRAATGATAGGLIVPRPQCLYPSTISNLRPWRENPVG